EGCVRSSTGQPVDVADEVHRTDEDHDVDDGVCQDQRHGSAVAQVEPAEDYTHDEVAEEHAHALVGVVKGAQHRTGRHRLPRCPAQLGKAVQQVADDDDLFEDTVLDRLQHQDRHVPPVTLQGAGGDGDGQPHPPGKYV